MRGNCTHTTGACPKNPFCSFIQIGPKSEERERDRGRKTEEELKKEKRERWRNSEHIGEQKKKEKAKFHRKHKNTKSD
jgi:hypothetical protein